MIGAFALGFYFGLGTALALMVGDSPGQRLTSLIFGPVILLWAILKTNDK